MQQRAARVEGKAGTLVATLAFALAITVGLTGCCFFRGLMGQTGYWVGIATVEEMNDSAPSPVLIVWPAPEQVSEFAGKTYYEVVEKLKILREGTDYVAADFGELPPRRDQRYYKMLGDESLERHCWAEKGFVYTVIGDMKGVQIRGEFTGYVMIHLGKDDVRAEYVATGQNWP